MTRVAAIAGHLVLWTVALGIATVTLAPFWDTNIWWVRLWDFPRLQILAAALAVGIAALLVPGRTRIVVPALMVAVCVFQVWRIFPYTPLAAQEMALAPADPDAVRIMSSNVLMENEHRERLIDLVREIDPDILLLMETDADWIEALEPMLAGYATVLRAPRDDHYGMVFATRLETETAEVVHLTGDGTPAILAQLRDRDGTSFRFVGLHPRPPLPGQGTAERDAEIYYAARFALASGMPVVATGDFNDVAWSDTSRTFKRVGRYLDPRIGRGLYSSFDADRWWLRFPIDQLYMTPDVAVVALERLPYIGSDHFPMAATVRFDATLASRLNVTPRPVSEDEEEIVERAMARHATEAEAEAE